MRVRVLYFGILKEVLGQDRDEVELAEGASVAVLVGSLRQRAQAQSRIWESIAIAVNQEYALHTTLLQNGDEVALLPPVSGGGREGDSHAC